MTTHVFIVNEDTFPLHLKHLFAGTGSKEKDEDISLLSDIKRVRSGDLVIFYIEATTKIKGCFFGVFRIADVEPIVFDVTGEDAKNPNLSKKLIYRTLIEPHEVYAEGLPEWEALDKLPVYSSEIQWSLIYRKLKGKRGCTPILPRESERLINMIRDKNSGKVIADLDFQGGFTWDKDKRKITTTNRRDGYPFQRKYEYNLVNVIWDKQRSKKAYEVHLQLYFTSRIGLDRGLEEITGENPFWIGNEVASGVGMQKIDIMTIAADQNNKKEYIIIELKDEPVVPGIVDQVEYYTRWASQKFCRHLMDAYEWNVQPFIIAPKLDNKNWNSVKKVLTEYNKSGISLPINYYQFTINKADNRLDFLKFEY